MQSRYVAPLNRYHVTGGTVSAKCVAGSIVKFSHLSVCLIILHSFVYIEKARPAHKVDLTAICEPSS
jgi:hypothetical protein